MVKDVCNTNMKILHIGLLSHFTAGMAYQDNILPTCNLEDGHSVTFITDTHIYQSGKLTKVPEEDITLGNSLRLIRLEYDKILNEFVTQKIQKVQKLKKLLEDLAPDSILYHGLCGWSLMVVADYVRQHPDTLFYVDSHEDFNNTARNILSKFAYKYIHGIFVKKSLPYIRKILFISSETREYIQDMYHISEKQLEWFPLGGIIHTPDERSQSRQNLLSELDLPSDCILLGHSGKLVANKKTKELINAFKKNTDKKLRLIIWGDIPDENKKDLIPLINSDKRIHYLGWKSENQLFQLLCACDIYCQPGTQSATMQLALCCGCPVMIHPYSSYKPYLNNNGWFVRDEKEIEIKIHDMVTNPQVLKEMSEQAYIFAKEQLDYKKLARRIYV